MKLATSAVIFVYKYLLEFLLQAESWTSAQESEIEIETYEIESNKSKKKMLTFSAV